MYIVLDLETTGLHPEKGDTILDIAAIKVFEDGHSEQFQTFVHPQGKIVSDFVLALTGIAMDDLLAAPHEKDALEQLRAFIGDTPLPIVGHNVGFDINFLQRRGYDISSFPRIDTNDIATLFVPEAPSHSLEVLALGFSILHTEKHTALGDVLATDELLRILKHMYMQKFQQSCAQALEMIREKFQDHDLLLFFDLPLPSPHAFKEFRLHTPKTTEKQLQMIQDVQVKSTSIVPNTLYTLPTFYPRAHILAALTQRLGSTLIVPYASIDLYKDIQGVFLFDHEKNILSRKEILKAWENATPEQGLWFLRYFATAPQDDFFHIADLALTHHERSFVHAYSLVGKDDTTQQMFLAFLKEKTVVTNHKEYFYGTYASMWHADTIILDEVSLLEHYLFAMSRLSLGADYLLQNLGELKDMLPSDIASQYATELFSIENIARYFFQNVSKSLGKTPMGKKEDFLEYIRTFIHNFMRGLGIIFDTLPEGHSAQRKISYLRDLIINIFEHEEEGTIGYFYQSQMGLSFIKECTSMEPYLQKIEQSTLYHFDTEVLENFPYMFSYEEHVSLADRTWNYKIQWEEIDMNTWGEQDDLKLVQPLVKENTKTLIMGGNSLKMEKIFDAYFEHPPVKKMYVAFPGKSGGKAKTMYRFHEEDTSLLLLQWKDVVTITLQDIDVVGILHLPFVVFAGQFFQDKYGNQSFMKLTVPLIVKQLHDFSDALVAQQFEQGVKVYLLDQRLYQKEYGKEIRGKL